nr:MAG TPA: hypothetical protein [Crassvirales sp.]
MILVRTAWEGGAYCFCGFEEEVVSLLCNKSYRYSWAVGLVPQFPFQVCLSAVRYSGEWRMVFW